jgi:hypothetical protein
LAFGQTYQARTRETLDNLTFGGDHLFYRGNLHVVLQAEISFVKSFIHFILAAPPYLWTYYKQPNVNSHALGLEAGLAHFGQLHFGQGFWTVQKCPVQN